MRDLPLRRKVHLRRCVVTGDFPPYFALAAEENEFFSLSSIPIHLQVEEEDGLNSPSMGLAGSSSSGVNPSNSDLQSPSFMEEDIFEEDIEGLVGG